MSPEEKVAVTVDGRTLTLTNLAKVLYPDDGFTKAEVLDYYQRVAPVLLPHIADRPVTLKRYPEGVDGEAFFQKHVTEHRPDWIRTATVSSASSRARGTMVTYLVIDDLPTLIWAANLAGLELHVPQWRMPDVREPDLLVFDLDPGLPADIVDCCRVALELRPLLEADGLAPLAKTSGGKGLQLYAPISGVTSDQASDSGPRLRRAAGASVARPRRVPDDQVPADGEGPHRLEPEQRLQDHRGALLAARPRPPHRLHPGQLGRGRVLPQGRRPVLHRRRGAGPGGSATATCSARCSS